MQKKKMKAVFSLGQGYRWFNYSPIKKHKQWGYNYSVLATLVEKKAIPDPFFGFKNEIIIDITDFGKEYHTFWFFATI